jgi:hypothetical protein
MSSAGVSTHTHFDQDHNIFLQVVGQKRVTLFPAAVHHTLYPFPRVHSLWHKSSVPFHTTANGKGVDKRGEGERDGGGRDGDRGTPPVFDGYKAALHAAEVVVLNPGDLLYIPVPCWACVVRIPPPPPPQLGCY